MESQAVLLIVADATSMTTCRPGSRSARSACRGSWCRRATTPTSSSTRPDRSLERDLLAGARAIGRDDRRPRPVPPVRETADDEHLRAIVRPGAADVEDHPGRRWQEAVAVHPRSRCGSGRPGPSRSCPMSRTRPTCHRGPAGGVEGRSWVSTMVPGTPWRCRRRIPWARSPRPVAREEELIAVGRRGTPAHGQSRSPTMLVRSSQRGARCRPPWRSAGPVRRPDDARRWPPSGRPARTCRARP